MGAAWTFEKIAGPFEGPTGGLAWDGSGMLFSAVAEGRILRYDPASGKTSEFRKYTNRTNGLAKLLRLLPRAHSRRRCGQPDLDRRSSAGHAGSKPLAVGAERYAPH